MPVEWLTVLPSIVASVVTTLLTLLITTGVGKVSRRSSYNDRPLILTRTPTGIRLRNRSKRALIDAQPTIYKPDGTWRDDPVNTLGTLIPGHEAYLAAEDNDTVEIHWMELRRNKYHNSWRVQFRLKPDVDEYTPEREQGGN